jgi:uncharacterized protein (TIGR03437 family)
MKRILALVAFTTAVFAQPSITAVLDGGAYTNDIAQGSVFVVKGTTLSAAGFVQATAPSYPTTLNNVRITLTAVNQSAVVNALMVYTYNLSGVNQLAAVLPSNTAVGAYDLRVINGTQTSVGFRTNVQARKPGIVTAAGDGAGAAQATVGNASALVRTSNLGKVGAFDSRPARPGERVDFWGTGLGPDVASDTGGTSGDQTAAAAIRVLINGTEVTPLYAGRSFGYPGLDQVAVNLPSNVTASCTVNIQIRSGGVLSNLVTIAVSTTDTCTPAGGGGGGGGGSTAGTTLTQGEIDAAIAKNALVQGNIALNRSTSYGYDVLGSTLSVTKQDSISAQFSRTSGPDLAKMLRGEIPPGFPNPVVGSCIVFQFNQLLQNPYPNLVVTNLDAGNPLTSVGPNGSASILRQTNQVAGPTYSTATNLANTYLATGRYTLSGPGGPQVGAFSGTLDTVSDFTLTNPNSFLTVNRNAPLAVAWSGGDSRSYATIQGISYGDATGTTLTGAGFICIVQMSQGSFTVPASILQQLPASPAISAGGFSFITRGSFSVTVGGFGAKFSPPSGIDVLTANNFWSWQFATQFN